MSAHHSHGILVFASLLDCLDISHVNSGYPIVGSPLLQVSQVAAENDPYPNSRFLMFGFILLLLVLIIALISLYRRNQELVRRDKRNQEVNKRVVTAVNHTDTLIVSLTKDGVIRLVNEAAINVHNIWVGIQLKAGDKITELAKGTSAEKIWESWIEKSRSVYSWSEVCKMNIQGREKYYRVNFSSIQKNNGQYTGLVMMGNDVTFEHEYQSELADEHRQLEKSNSDQEQMMGILAHDLKDSIYSAHSMSKMVLEDQDDFDRDHLLKLFEMLHNNFEKTQELLESLLAWQKTRNVNTEVRYKELRLHNLVNEVRSTCQEGINRKNLKVLNLIDKKQMVTTDSEMLKTVLRNLLSNAIKYTSPDEGEIKFEAIENSEVEIHVSDNGRGMHQEEIDSILSGSKGISKPGTLNENGCGIGLYLCQELLRINQSKLQINSEPGKGSDFFFKVRRTNN